MSFNDIEKREELRRNRKNCFYGRRYFYVTASDGNQVIGVLKGLGDAWIAGYIRESGSRKSLKAKRLWASTHPDDLQKRLAEWAKKKGLTEVPE
ncbi:MAG: hypothetical protein VB050_03380 [Geobacteraceae bacterium]|nr:hypothetical protein [Geobacteraceae bacterium]